MAISHRETVELTHAQPADMGDRLTGLFRQAPLAIAYVEGKDHRYQFVNDLYVQAAGRSRASDLIGLPIREAISELEGSGVFELLDEVYRTGAACRRKDYKVSLRQGASGTYEDRYFDFSYEPI